MRRVSTAALFQLILHTRDPQTQYLATEALADQNYNVANMIFQFPAALPVLVRNLHGQNSDPVLLLLLMIKSDVRLRDALLESLLIEGSPRSEFLLFGALEDLARLAKEALDPRARDAAQRLLQPPLAGILPMRNGFILILPNGAPIKLLQRSS